MALQRSGELKKRAWLAKQRLKMGYWDAVENSDGAAGEPVRRMKAAVVNDDGLSIADEKMYSKVCSILDRDETTINPIGQLIDSEIYDGLDPAGKQRYILELSEKFRELKERYYRERTGA